MYLTVGSWVFVAACSIFSGSTGVLQLRHVGPRSLTRPSALGARGLSHWASGEFPWIEGICHTLLGRQSKEIPLYNS